ncbi:MAG: hypothetical protein R3B90_01860 [Planctomycetaceae bacterium]
MSVKLEAYGLRHSPFASIGGGAAYVAIDSHEEPLRELWDALEAARGSPCSPVPQGPASRPSVMN